MLINHQGFLYNFNKQAIFFCNMPKQEFVLIRVYLLQKDAFAGFKL